MGQETVDKFTRHLQATKPKNTANTYSKAVVKFENYLISIGLDIETLTLGTLDDYVAWLTEQQYSPASISTWIAAVVKYVRFLKKAGFDVPEVQSVELPAVHTKDPESLSEPELITFMKAASSELLEPTRTALILMPFCGLRSAEIVSLGMGDVLTEKVDGKINAYFKVVRKGGAEGKVPLLEEGKLLLLSYLREYRSTVRGKNKFLFPGNDNGHIGTRSLREGCENLSLSTGIEKLRTHILRKTYATMLFQKGVPIGVISQNLGHASVDMTMKAYIGKDIVHSMRQTQGIELLGKRTVKEITTHE